MTHTTPAAFHGSTRPPAAETLEHLFHRLVVRDLVRLSRAHKANDERIEAAELLELARLHTEHALRCARATGGHDPLPSFLYRFRDTDVRELAYGPDADGGYATCYPGCPGCEP